MPLTDVAVRNAKPEPKTIRIRDERGIYLEISPKGGKWWRLRFMIKGKANMLSLGVYPVRLLSHCPTPCPPPRLTGRHSPFVARRDAALINQGSVAACRNP